MAMLPLKRNKITLLSSGLVVEAPACGTIRLGSSDPECRVKHKVKEIPGRRSGAWGTERSRKGIALRFNRPSTVTVHFGHFFQRWLISYSTCVTFQDKVNPLQPD